MRKKEQLKHSEHVRSISKTALRLMAIEDYYKIRDRKAYRPKWSFTEKQQDKFASELGLTKEEFKIYYAYFVAISKGSCPFYI